MANNPSSGWRMRNSDYRADRMQICSTGCISHTRRTSTTSSVEKSNRLKDQFFDALDLAHHVVPSSSLALQKPKLASSTFSINHYAGPVEYTVSTTAGSLG